MKIRWLDLLKRTFHGWMDVRAPRLSAALAFYSIFSIAPLLVIIIGILGLVFGEKAVSGELYGELSGYMGPSTAGAIESMVQSASKPTQGVVATVSGLMMLIVGPVRVLRRVVDRHTGLVVFLAITAGTIPALLVFRNKRSRDRELPSVMISVAKSHPPESELGALLLGTLGVLARTITPALIKSAIILQAIKFLAKRAG